jgi:hypothetical protein
MADIFDRMGCDDCPYYTPYYADGGGCPAGSFGDDYPCEGMLSCIEEAVENGGIELAWSRLISAGYLTDPETREDNRDLLSAWPGVDWSKHPYWRLFYDDTPPEGYDSLEEVYERVFQ